MIKADPLSPVTCALLRSRSMATGWNDLRHPQADRIEERSVLSVAALTSAGYDQRVQVEEPVEGRIPGSARRTLPFSVMALSQFLKMVTQRSSSQSSRIFFMM